MGPSLRSVLRAIVSFAQLDTRHEPRASLTSGLVSWLSCRSRGSAAQAHDKRDGKIVAIKVLEVEGEDYTELQKEINILKECKSPYIVEYRGSFEKDGNIWVGTGFFRVLTLNTGLLNDGGRLVDAPVK